MDTVQLTFPHAASAFTIGVIQMQMREEKEINIQTAERLLREAAGQGVQVACLPEIFTGLYFCQNCDTRYFDMAEPIPGETTLRMQALAKELGIAIVVPLFERAGAGVYYNSVAVVDADGALLGTYRKMHIPHDPLFEEKYYFAPGDLGFKTFDTRFGRIGVLICWDQWFPEAARLTAMQGAQVLFYPTAIGWHPAEKAEFGAAQVDAWTTAQRAHAIANGVYVAAANRIGHEVIVGDGLEFFGHSFIADPFGRLVERLDETAEGVLISRVDPKTTEQVRRWWPFFRDRRVDAYGDLTQRYRGA